MLYCACSTLGRYDPPFQLYLALIFKMPDNVFTRLQFVHIFATMKDDFAGLILANLSIADMGVRWHLC